jgi:hypothetical protein
LNFFNHIFREVYSMATGTKTAKYGRIALVDIKDNYDVRKLGLNTEQVTQYRDIYKAGGENAMPPVVLFPNFVTGDGRHRIAAAKAAGLTHLPYIINPETDPLKQRALSLQWNCTQQPTPQSNADFKFVITEMLAISMNDEKLTRLSVRKVYAALRSNIRKLLAATGRPAEVINKLTSQAFHDWQQRQASAACRAMIKENLTATEAASKFHIDPRLIKTRLNKNSEDAPELHANHISGAMTAVLGKVKQSHAISIRSMLKKIDDGCLTHDTLISGLQAVRRAMDEHNNYLDDQIKRVQNSKKVFLST